MVSSKQVIQTKIERKRYKILWTNNQYADKKNYSIQLSLTLRLIKINFLGKSVYMYSSVRLNLMYHLKAKVRHSTNYLADLLEMSIKIKLV